jgi:hypothetical protein
VFSQGGSFRYNEGFIRISMIDLYSVPDIEFDYMVIYEVWCRTSDYINLPDVVSMVLGGKV